MDSRGKTLAILKMPNGKIITRENEVIKGNQINLKIFNVPYPFGFHAEVRVILSILKNSYWLELIKHSKFMDLTVIRYTNTGKLAISSKPCEKCQIVLREFKKKFLYEKFNIVVNYFENGQPKQLFI